MKISDILTPNPTCIAPGTSVQQAAEQMMLLDVGILPVWDAGRLVGTVTDRDITIRAVARGRDARHITVGDVMSEGVFSCFDDQDLAEAVLLMEEKQVRRLPVLDRDHRLVGIVSLGDLAVRTGSDALAGEVLARVAARESEAYPHYAP